MSRVAKMPVPLPAGVEVTIAEGAVSVKGPKGVLSLKHSTDVGVKKADGALQVSTLAGSTMMAGTVRALLKNLVDGVSKGFERKLELVGVGFRAAMVGKDLNLTIGFSHPVLFKAPEGISIETPTQTEVMIKGLDKQRVGEVAAKIRAFRPPEPYKGKGIKYSGEKITLKEVKKA
jgi:large subunit ribosomal protein L6